MDDDSGFCNKTAEAGFVCTLQEGHPGDVHVAQTSDNRVVYVWRTETVTKTEDVRLWGGDY